MKKYGITYSLLASGYIEIEAKTKREAEETAFSLATTELLNSADFEDSLEIDGVEEV